jgi:hypothetical protein
MKDNIALTDEKTSKVSDLAKLYGIATDECVDWLLTRYVFESCGLELFVEDAEQIVCQDRPEAEALAKRVEKFVAENRKDYPNERLVRVSVVQYSDGWGVKAVLKSI